MQDETQAVVAVSLKLNIPYVEANTLVKNWLIDYPEYDQQSLLDWTLAGDVAYVDSQLRVTPYTTDQELSWLVDQMLGPEGLEITDRWYQLKLYRNCFVGSEAVKWLMQSQGISRELAIRTGQRLIERDIIHHVVDDIGFDDEYLFYRFTLDVSR